MIRVCIGLIACLVISACAGERAGFGWPYTFTSRFMPVEPVALVQRVPLILLEPERFAVLLYMPGSGSEPTPDSCITTRPGINVPHTITDLAGQQIAGLTVLVYVYCTPTRVGGFNQADGDGVTKVMKRSFDIEGMVQEFARIGISGDRLILAGQSAGAWASLLVARRGQARIAGVLGTAPAFAGHHKVRPPIWQEERARQITYLSEAPHINALLFQFEGDRLEPPEHTEFLNHIHGIDRVILKGGDAIGGIPCDNAYPHATAFKDCFRQTQRERILAAIEAWLPAQ